MADQTVTASPRSAAVRTTTTSSVRQRSLSNSTAKHHTATSTDCAVGTL